MFGESKTGLIFIKIMSNQSTKNAPSNREAFWRNFLDSPQNQFQIHYKPSGE